MEYYVYCHKRLKDNSIFYIGKGKGDRFNSDIARNQYWNRIVKKDGGFISEIIKDNLTSIPIYKCKRGAAPHRSPTDDEKRTPLIISQSCDILAHSLQDNKRH